MWSSNKVFKDIKIFWTVHSRPFIRYQGKNLDLSSIYDTVLNFSCVASCKLTKSFTFLSYHFYHKNQTLALGWRQNSCSGTTLIIFLVVTYWATWRVITCSPLALRQCFINTAQYYFSPFQKYYQIPVHDVAYGRSFLLHI